MSIYFETKKKSHMRELLIVFGYAFFTKTEGRIYIDLLIEKCTSIGDKLRFLEVSIFNFVLIRFDFLESERLDIKFSPFGFSALC